jgi:NAD/NADP transhydrogenase beta subunit
MFLSLTAFALAISNAYFVLVLGRVKSPRTAKRGIRYANAGFAIGAVAVFVAVVFLGVDNKEDLAHLLVALLAGINTVAGLMVLDRMGMFPKFKNKGM